ncbi:MAG: DUF2628 domain-containing protein [Hyphomicrobiales bacterium]|nr:DUF2628 domain-containing protein [Hyphomicrobiales bacterium]
MSIFFVHEPATAASPAERAMNTIFVKDGFRWLALFFTPLWLLAQRLWLEFALWLLASLGLALAVRLYGLNPGTALLINLLISLYCGFEGASMIEARLERGERPLTSVVAGASRDEAEQRYFAAPPQAQRQEPQP